MGDGCIGDFTHKDFPPIPLYIKKSSDDLRQPTTFQKWPVTMAWGHGRMNQRTVSKGK